MNTNPLPAAVSKPGEQPESRSIAIPCPAFFGTFLWTSDGTRHTGCRLPGHQSKLLVAAAYDTRKVTAHADKTGTVAAS